MEAFPEEIKVSPELEEVMLPRHETDLLASSWSCISKDVVCLMEFCESVGPKPILTLPFGLNLPHLNLDDISLMMMTGDAQLNAKLSPGSQNLAQGYMVVEEQGLALVNMNFSLSDVAARGHVRQFAIAYLSPNCDDLRIRYCTISRKLRELVRELSCCNNCQYREELSYILHDCEENENERQMIDMISCDFSEARSILDKWRNIVGKNNNSCKGAHVLFSISEFTATKRKLRNLTDLTCCFYDQFICRLSDLLTEPSPGASSDAIAIACRAQSNASDPKLDQERPVLWQIQQVLPHLIFGLYTGHQIVVGGSHIRRQAVSDIVEQLACVLLPEVTHGFKSAMVWNEGELTLEISGRYALVGQFLAKHENLLASRLAQLFYILDLNRGSFSGVLYRGGLLSDLFKWVLRKCSDQCLRQRISTIYCSYWVLAYLLFHILYKDQSSYRTNIHQLSSICSSLRISGSDLKILKHFIQTFKGDGPTMSGMQESMIMSENTISVVKL